MAEPNDTYYNLEWAMRNSGQNPGGSHPGTPGCDIDAEWAWNLERGNRDIVIGSLDTGLDLNHPEFASDPSYGEAQIWRNLDEIPSNGVDDDANGYIDDTLGWDFINSDNWPQADHKHGTHTAGTIGARGDNARGVAGVLWYCHIMPVKVLDAGMSGPWDKIASGIRYAADNGCRIINMSLGGTIPSTPLQDAVNYAWNKGVLVVASMGNIDPDVSTVFYPAAYDNAFAVAATDNDDTRMTKGQNGSTMWSNYGSWVDVAAPGVYVYSTIWDDTYNYDWGTSMAAPHVSGIAAMLLSRNPDLTNQQLRDIIESTAEDIGAPGFDNYFGHGRVNAFAALCQVKAMSGWEPEQKLVSGTTDQPCYEPDMAVRGADVHIVYSDRHTGPNGAVYYLHSEDGGRTFLSGVQLAAYQYGYYDYSPAIAVDGNTLHVVFCDNRSGNAEVYYKRSTNNGSSWSSDVRLSTTGVDSYSPDVCCVGSTVHVVWKPGYCKSTDAGATWGSVNSGIIGEAIAASGSYVLVAGIQSNQVKTYRFNGASWEAAVQLSSGLACLMPDVAFGGSNVYVTWTQDADGDGWYENIHLRRSTNSGANWQADQLITANGKNSGFVRPRVAAKGDSCHLVWWGDRDEFYEYEIYHRVSTDKGANWGNCHRLTYQFTGEYDHDPAIALVGDTVHVAWCRYPPTGPEYKSVYYRRTEMPEAFEDAAVTMLMAPTSSIDSSAVVKPKAAVENKGEVEMTFTPWFVITRTGTQVYRQPATAVTLSPGTGQSVEFPEWAKPHQPADYAMKCSLAVSDDQPDNDFLTGSFTVTEGSSGWNDDLQAVPDDDPPSGVNQGGWTATGELTDAARVVFVAKGKKSNAFYAYFPDGDTWQRLPGMPYAEHPNEDWRTRPPSKGSQAVFAQGRLYVTQGNNTRGFWSYDPAARAWQAEEDVPEGDGKKVKSGSDMVYVPGTVDQAGYIYLLKGGTRDFYRFDLDTRKWDAALSQIPLGQKDKVDAGSWLAYNEGAPGQRFVFGFKAKYRELYCYDLDNPGWGPALNQMPLEGWHKGRRLEKKAKDGGCAAFYNSSIYALKGGNTQQFWRYQVSDNSWHELDTIPTTSRSVPDRRRLVKSGADICHMGAGKFYILRGAKTRDILSFQASVACGSRAAVPERNGVQAGESALTGLRFAVGPDPVASGFATLRIQGTRGSSGRVASVRVFDAAGRCVLVRPLVIGDWSLGIPLDCGRLASGIYLVRLDAEGMARTQKLVVQR